MTGFQGCSFQQSKRTSHHPHVEIMTNFLNEVFFFFFGQTHYEFKSSLFEMSFIVNNF